MKREGSWCKSDVSWSNGCSVMAVGAVADIHRDAVER